MHLYIHVPFCARRCSYCDFAIAVRREVPSAAFQAAVLREWEGWQSHPAWADSPGLDTVYFGGGTPSRLDPSAIEALLAGFRACRPLAADAEITLEANPDDVTPARVEQWARAGINRVSLGAQSFSEAALGWMHRTHDADQIGRAVATVREAGIHNLSLDLIYGLPDSVRRDWTLDLDRALALEPTHISLYGLTIEAGTPLGRWTARGDSPAPSDERAAGEYLEAHASLGKAGYEHYEVSNAALPGFRARHNLGYWNRRPFIGLGPSAHSGFHQTRCWNVREWQEYRIRSEAGQPVRADQEELRADQIELEELYLGLRTTEGISVTTVPAGVLTAWGEAGWALARGGRLRLTALGWLRLDPLVASLTHC